MIHIEIGKAEKLENLVMDIPVFGGAAPAPAAPVPAPEAAPEAAPAGEKKVIRTASLNITTTAFDDSLLTLRTLCETSGGWVAYASESSGSSRRTASLTLRIPSAQLDAFLEGAGGAGRVTRKE